MAKFTGTISDPSQIKYPTSSPTYNAASQAFNSIVDIGGAIASAYAGAEKQKQQLQAQLAKEGRAEQRTIRTEQRAEQRRLEQEALDRTKQAAEDETLSGLQTNLLQLEDEERIINTHFADMRNNIENAADQQSITKLRKDYNKLYQLELTGSSGSVAARRSALLKQFIAANPHLRKEAMDITGATDSMVSIGLGEATDPIAKASEELQAQSVRTNMPTRVLMDTANLQAKATNLEAQEEVSAKTRDLSFDQLYQNSTAIGNAITLQLDSTLNEIVNSAPDEGIDGPAVYKQMQMFHQLHVNNAVNNAIDKARRSGLQLSKEEIASLKSSYEGAGLEPYKSLIEENDRFKLVENLKTMRSNQAEIRSLASAEEFYKNYPVARMIEATYGKNNMMGLMKEVVRAKSYLSSGKGELHKQQLETNPEYKMAWYLFGERTMEMFDNRMSEGGKPTGNNALDDMVDNAAVKAFQVGELNQTGTESMLNNLLVNGFSNNNRRMLLSDKSITQFKNDDEAKTGLLNFTANTFTSELMRKTAEIEDLGYKIDFDPNQRQRVREGNNYHPAEAFTITSDDGSTVNKDFRLFIHKLNTLWTLNNSIRSNEEMDKLGAAMVKRVDRDNPEFIKNSATQKIGEMMQLRDKVAKFYERRLSGSFTPSIYSSEEQQATYRQNQMDELATRMRKFDELIGDQRIRLGEIAEGSFSKIQDLPTGLTQRDIDMANATTAVQQGQPLKGNTQEMTMDETGVIKPVPMPDVDESSPKATPMPKTNQVRKITKEELDAFINGMSNRK